MPAKILKMKWSQSPLIFICKYINLKFFRNTPRKGFSSEYLNSIISPFKEFAMKPLLDSPYNPGNFNISSADNHLKFNSPMNRK